MAVGGRLTGPTTSTGTWGQVVVDEAAIAALASPAGPVAAYLAKGAQRVAQGAKRRAPTSRRGSGGRRSGYLRSEIGWAIGTDADGLYVVVASPATTKTGGPYGLFQNVPHLMGRARNGRRYPITTTPHLLPALEQDWPAR
jgi:hypothetical protein